MTFTCRAKMLFRLTTYYSPLIPKSTSLTPVLRPFIHIQCSSRQILHFDRFHNFSVCKGLRVCSNINHTLFASIQYGFQTLPIYRAIKILWLMVNVQSLHAASIGDLGFFLRGTTINNQEVTVFNSFSFRLFTWQYVYLKMIGHTTRL